MRTTPLFDTNVFSDAANGDISQREWTLLKKQRPRRGWPLSAVTAMELLAGVDAVPDPQFSNARDAIRLAYELSAGRILPEPRALICEKIFARRLPEVEIRPALLSKHMLVACRAANKRELLEGRVLVARLSRHSETRGGFDPALITQLLRGPKETWVAALAAELDTKSPFWRERAERGKRHLPDESQKRMDQPEVWVQHRAGLLKSFTDWLAPGLTEEEVQKTGQRIDAVLQLAISIVKDVLLRNYAFSKHESDIYDLLQLHYLAFDQFTFVTRDQRLMSKLRQSSQADRILVFRRFLATL
jgi:hypothetical protein